MRQRRPLTASHAKRLQQLAAAVDAYRGGHRRRRLSGALRAQAVATIDAGAPVHAVREACKVSASQLTRWRQDAARSAGEAARSSTAVASPRVLSVVEADARETAPLDSEIELRIGGWHVSLRRVVP